MTTAPVRSTPSPGRWAAPRQRLRGGSPLQALLLAMAILIMTASSAAAAPLVIRVPATASIPAVEPPPAGEKATNLVAAAMPPAKARRMQVTVFPLSHPGVTEAAAVPVLRGLSQSLRNNQRLDMKDLDSRLSDFAQEVPADQIELAETAYQKGREAMQQKDFEGAITQLEDAVDTLVVLLPYIKKQELADAMLALAAAQLQKGNRRACNAALIRLLTWRPDYQLDTTQFPPEIQDPLEEARRAVGKLAHGQARIESEPEGAQVFVDGSYLGVTPLEVPDLLVGEHFVTFKKIGFRKGLRVLTVGSRSQASVSGKLANSEKFLLVKQALERVEKGMGGTRLDPVVDNLKETMYLDHGVFLRLAPGDGTAVKVTADLYDLRSRILLKEATLQLAATDDADARMAQLGETLYAGVDYEGTPKPPEEPPPPPKVVRKPLYKKWWFLTAVGAVLVGGAAAVGIGVSATRSPSCPSGHVCTGPLLYF